jgi:5-methylthioadenosine/S-adenosylhomocysteine deaminase
MSRRPLIAGSRLPDPDEELHQPPVQDLLIVDGCIAATGEAARAWAGDAMRLDATSCLVTPGFVNAHSHAHDMLLRGLFEALPREARGLLALHDRCAAHPLDSDRLRLA